QQPCFSPVAGIFLIESPAPCIAYPDWNLTPLFAKVFKETASPSKTIDSFFRLSQHKTLKTILFSRF
ncbi:hypothetical protein C7B61_17640, partial [filamentous cyanobacterium CCP1]